MPVTLKTGSKAVERMTNGQFEREKNYRVAVSIAKTMLKRGLITSHEYRRIDKILIRKYRPVFGGLCG